MTDPDFSRFPPKDARPFAAQISAALLRYTGTDPPLPRLTASCIPPKVQNVRACAHFHHTVQHWRRGRLAVCEALHLGLFSASERLRWMSSILRLFQISCRLRPPFCARNRSSSSSETCELNQEITSFLYSSSGTKCPIVRPASSQNSTLAFKPLSCVRNDSLTTTFCMMDLYSPPSYLVRVNDAIPHCSLNRSSVHGSPRMW